MSISNCAHVFEDRHRCGSPALRGESHCYYHHPDRKPVSNPYARRSRRGFQIEIPDNPASRQVALYQIMDRLASNRLDVNRAKLLLYSIQMTSQ